MLLFYCLFLVCFLTTVINGSNNIQILSLPLDYWKEENKELLLNELTEFENTGGTIWAIDPLKKGFIVTRSHSKKSNNKFDPYIKSYKNEIKGRSLVSSNDVLRLRLITTINHVTPEILFKQGGVIYKEYERGSFLHGENNVLHIDLPNTQEWRKKIILNDDILYFETGNKPIKSHDKYVYSYMMNGEHHQDITTTTSFSSKDIIVSVVDTGLDLSHPAYNKQQDIPRYYLNRNNYNDIVNRINMNRIKLSDGDILAYFALEYNDKKHHDYKLSDFYDTFSGHGTHVASSAVPPLYNTSVNPFYSKSLLAFFDIQLSLSEKLSLPGTLKWILATSYGIGSRFLSCSWGSEEDEYNTYAYELDYFIHQNYDYTAVFSVGNNGPGDGTLNSPGGTCKNCISVGASLNSYDSFVEYSKKPYFMMSENKNSTYTLVKKSIDSGYGLYNNQNLASFSSRSRPGERIKPDVVFPGEEILALRSQGIKGCTMKTETGVCSTEGRYYTLKMGTSMSTPLLMASLTYIEPYLQLNHVPASLRKGLIVASSEWLTGGSQQFSLDNKTNEIFIKNRNTTTIPLHEQGHGLPRPYRIVDGEFSFFPMEEIYSFSKNKNYCFSLEREETPITFVMVYDDPPLIGGSLVNNLNMRVTQYVKGVGINVLEIYDANNGTYPDSINNVEKITIRNTKRGDIFRVSISVEGLIYSLRKFKRAYQSQYYSFIWSSVLSPVPCPDSSANGFIKWDIPRSCILTNTTYGYYNPFTDTCNSSVPIRVSCKNGKYKTIVYPNTNTKQQQNEEECQSFFKDRYNNGNYIPGVKLLQDKSNVIRTEGRVLFDKRKFRGIGFYLSLMIIFLFGTVFYLKMSSVHNRNVRIFINNRL